MYVESALIDFERHTVISRPDVSLSGDCLLERNGTLYGTATVGGASTYIEIPRTGEDYQGAYRPGLLILRR